MKKQVISWVLCVLLLLSMAACKPTSSPASSTGDGTDSTGTSSATVSGESGQDSASTDTNSTSGNISSPSGDESIKTKSKTTLTNTTAPRKKIKAAVDKSLIPLTGSADSAFWYNPDRGFRGSTSLDVFTMTLQKDMKAYATAMIKGSTGQSENDPGDTTLVMQNYFYLGGFNNRDITPKGLQAIETFFEAQMELGIKGQPRFCYSRDMPDPVNDAPQEIIMRHIDQLAPIIKKVKNGIQAFPICFVGAWGEWHSEYYELDKVAIGKAVMEKLVVPNDLYGLMRLPNYKNLLKGTPHYSRIGIENDSIFGKIPAGYGGASGTGGLDDNTPQWDQLIKEAAFTPQEGELYWNYWLTENKVTVDGFKTILQLSEHRFTTLSIHHSYLDMENKSFSEIGKWKKQNLTEQWLKDNKIIFDPNWFKNSKGQIIKRNVFEFVRDHLGYRVAAQHLKVVGDGKPSSTLQVEMPLINYGFSAAFNLQSGFAILDENNKVISTVKSGTPEKWYNRNPNNYSDDRRLTYVLKADVKLPSAPGRYKLAFFLKNDMGQFARIGNELDMVKGYHILHSFDI